MPSTTTFDDVTNMFQETAMQMRETDRKIQESFAQTTALMRETDRKFQETDRQFKETDRKIQETTAQTAALMRETAAYMHETTAQMRETDRIVKEVSQKIGGLGGRWGEFVEGLVAPACETLFAERGIPIHKVSRQVKAKLPGGRHMEIDVFVANTDAVALVEVKSFLTVGDVRGHLARMVEFKDFFPEYADKQIFGAVAGIVIEENADRFAMKKGLFVMVQSGNAVRMANDAAFQPRAW